MDEFGFISQVLSQLAGPEGLALKDDAALWSPPKGQQAVINLDTLVEGVHFPLGKFDHRLAEKLLAVNVSDLTAKAATPLGYLLSLSLGKNVTEDGLFDFCNGLARAQSHYGVKLWGGDTTRSSGETNLSLTLIGTVESGKMLKRSGARPGDLLCVTGTIGDAWLGLQCVQDKMNATQAKTRSWLERYFTPEPPFELAGGLGKYASAALDVSDGLVADAGHLAQVSGVGVEIYLTTLPLSSDASGWLLCQEDHIEARLKLATGGDDYQCLFAIKPSKLSRLQKLARQAGIRITTIGKITKGQGVRCLDSIGRDIPVETPGYSHF